MMYDTFVKSNHIPRRKEYGDQNRRRKGYAGAFKDL